MKSDVLMYEKIYKIIKNKIECGLLPPGSRLPSRSALCREFHTSERTVRRAVEMLERDGLLKTSQRQRPVVIFEHAKKRTEMPEEQSDPDPKAYELIQSGILLFYPVYRRGMQLCRGTEWEIPRTIVSHMDPSYPAEFWRLVNRFWRFFMSRNENEMIMRVADSFDFDGIVLWNESWEIREEYRMALVRLIQTAQSGGEPEFPQFDYLFKFYSVLSRQEGTGGKCRLASDTSLRLNGKKMEQQFRKAEERYSAVYMDILGLIAIGRYQPGDCLPSHIEMQQFYGVSVDTTMKAVQTLQKMGVVTAKRGHGIYVDMNLDGLKQIQIDPGLIACHLRRYLDSLELITLSIEGIAAKAAESLTTEEMDALLGELAEIWEGEHIHQLFPLVLLDFIVRHIPYDILRSVYEVLQKNYSIGRSIPKLVNCDKTPESQKLYDECIEAVSLLRKGQPNAFGTKTAEVFGEIHRLVVLKCKKLGYWLTALNVYDGSKFWK